MINKCGDTQAKALANHFFNLRTGAKLIVLKKVMGYFRDPFSAMTLRTIDLI